jgi:hypothetical protein
MKQTASEWLIDQVEDYIGLIPVDIIEQAKEMEKQQIIDAFEDGYDLNNSLVNYNGEQYYNDTFREIENL